ncbi:trypsin-like peptidase domain-containing protein [Candidatus Roizmanbacteria bacterium]|nr:trypsin-like peptidase domain-containing protein [Candidatus Roizmanbacteria bacterium]
MRKLILIVVVLIVLLGLWSGVSSSFPNLSNFVQEQSENISSGEKVKIVSEESVVVDTVKKIGPSVVTVAQEVISSRDNLRFGPFSIFGIPQEPSGPQDIGSGFIVTSDGLIITNKHVVSNREARYKVITSDDKEFDVERIYRDPLNDVAILKISPPSGGLKSVELGDSSKLEVGQFVIAIGTALGEFRSTVTTGVISGLGRGITAGSAFEGFVERLDNVIQTDAAINPGNSGGPLVNSSSQVIGVNTAIAASGENIGFALPINIIKDSLKNFNQTGQFNRPFLGVSYRIISRDAALLNEVPQGAYIEDVVGGSAAEKAGIEPGDIITQINGDKINEDSNKIASVVASKKVGDIIKISYWRDGKIVETQATLGTAPDQ